MFVTEEHNYKKYADCQTKPLNFLILLSFPQCSVLLEVRCYLFYL